VENIKNRHLTHANMSFGLSLGRFGRPSDYVNMVTLTTYLRDPQMGNVHQRTLGIPPLDHGK